MHIKKQRTQKIHQKKNASKNPKVQNHQNNLIHTAKYETIYKQKDSRNNTHPNETPKIKSRNNKIDNTQQNEHLKDRPRKKAHTQHRDPQITHKLIIPTRHTTTRHKCQIPHHHLDHIRSVIGHNDLRHSQKEDNKHRNIPS